MPNPNPFADLVDLLLQQHVATLPGLDPQTRDAVAKQAQAQFPAWKQHAITGINDLTQGILGAIGLGDSNDKANEVGQMLQAIVPIASPVRDPIWRAAVHENLLSGAARVSEPAVEAITDLIDRYPRLTAHVTSIQPSSMAEESASGGYRAWMTPNKVSREARASIHLDPYPDEGTTRNTAAHELQHVADLVRDADRARHAGLQGPASTLTNAAYNRYPYWTNPYEVAARVTGEAQDVPRGIPNRLAIARERAGVTPNSVFDAVPPDLTLQLDPQTHAVTVAPASRHAASSRESRVLSELEQVLVARAMQKP